MMTIKKQQGFLKVISENECEISKTSVSENRSRLMLVEKTTDKLRNDYLVVTTDYRHLIENIDIANKSIVSLDEKISRHNDIICIIEYKASVRAKIYNFLFKNLWKLVAAAAALDVAYNIVRAYPS